MHCGCAQVYCKNRLNLAVQATALFALLLGWLYKGMHRYHVLDVDSAVHIGVQLLAEIRVQLTIRLVVQQVQLAVKQAFSSRPLG